MTTTFAPAPKKAISPYNVAYANLIKLCPDLGGLKEGDYITLTAKNKAAPNVLIGCKQGVYEIVSTYHETKVYTTVDICTKTKTAEALVFETYEKDGTKKTTLAENAAPTRLNDLLNHLGKNYYPQKSASQISSMGY